MSEDLKHERRRFERIDIDPKATAYVTDNKGTKQGELRQLGRGGFLITTTGDTNFKKDKKQKFVIVDPSEDLKISVHAMFCYFKQGMAGFEFQDLDADSAVKVGILIGKYYVSDTSILHLEKP
jgi:c-di-GMP-binding flagellar brake protein YcgR